MADALAVFYLGKRSAAQEHEESVALLFQLGIDRREVERSASHLTKLLQVKNRAEYEERLLAPKDADQAARHLSRFRTWARSKLP